MDADSSSRTEGQGLRRVLTVPHAVAIYVSSVLGAGILVIPGLAARTAGAGSLVAWVGLSFASYPFAYTFSRLSARRGESGGIYSFATEAFGPTVSTMTAWLFVAWVALGAPAITLAAGSYLAYAFPISGFGVFAVASGIVAVAYGINLRGIRFTGRVQIIVVALTLGILALSVVASVPTVKTANFVPLFPNGIVPVGVASALIVWSYLGYENVSNVAGEFEDPARDFGKSVTISVALVSVLYVAVAATVIGTGAYQSGGGVIPFAEMMTNVFGQYAGVAVSLLAVVIIFSTVNAYTAGMGRLVYAAAKSGSLPRGLAQVDARTGVPQRALVALFGLIMLDLLIFYIFDINLQSAFLAASGAAVLTYVVGSAAGIRLLREGGAKKTMPWISLAVSLIILPFIGEYAVAGLGAAVLGLTYLAVMKRREK
jgi:amino acid efflux transporter